MPKIVHVVRLLVLEEHVEAVRAAIQRLLQGVGSPLRIEVEPRGAWVRVATSRTRTRLAARPMDAGSITLEPPAARALCRSLRSHTVIIGTERRVSVANLGRHGWRGVASLRASCRPAPPGARPLRNVA